MSDVLNAALQYAADGWHVFPLGKGGKTPLTAHGFKDATLDIDTITKWWTATPNANIGCSCGPSNLLVVDLDTDGEERGWNTWEALCRANGDGTVPHTRIHITPSGGAHHLFRSDHGLRNTAGKLGKLIDTRAVGGYVVLPPSTIDGNAYQEWNTDTPAPLPRWVWNLLKPKPIVWGPLPARNTAALSPHYGQKALEGELFELMLAPVGQRNHRLNQAAFAVGSLWAGGVLTDLRAAVDDLRVTGLRIGLGEHEVDATIQSGVTAGARSPRRVTA